LISWYYGIFGNDFRLIADILSYHPLTRGIIRQKDGVAAQYHLVLEQNLCCIPDFYQARKRIAI